MKRLSVCAAAAIALASSGAFAVPIGANVAVTVDDTGGRSVDADFSLSPGKHVTLSAGAGHSSGSDETADIAGTLLSAGISVHGERAGVSLDYDSFDDSSDYRSATLAGRAWFDAGDFRIALLARRRDLDVGLTLELPLRTVHREVSFSGLGGGLQLTLTRESFSAYAQALVYEYDDEFDDFMALTESPQLSERPRIEALVGTFLLQAQGAIDRQLGAGAERAFGRHSLALDLSSVHDAIRDADSTSLALTWRYAQSARLDWSVTAGLVDSDTVGDVAFAGVALGITN